MTGRSQPRAAARAVLVFVVAVVAAASLRAASLACSGPEGAAPAADVAHDERIESMLIEQPLRISAALQDVVPSDGNAPAAFFIGFAGFGEERVFAEEIRFAAGVIAERYGTADRSLLLLNDRRDIESQPIATVSSLRYALHAMAARMDLERDVLFLSLSSHGSEDFLVVSHEPLMLENLTDEALADALEDAGIKWRVIVISACHSGSFIDELRNPDTIVITAAAADRTSFGCTDDRALTYFGEAFYRDALPGADSLRAAFKKTTEAITRRERREDIEPSHPQAYFGKAIEARLGQLEGGAAR